VNCCLAAQRNDVATIRVATEALVTRNEAVLSTAVRRADGSVVFTAGNHDEWQTSDAQHSSATMVQVPILAGKSRWGTAEIRFRPLSDGLWLDPVLNLIVFVAGTAVLAFTFYLKKTLRHLDPSSVVPDRVRATLDSEDEGRRTFAVNTTPILGADGKRRGALATFDDVTSIEKKNQKLEEMLQALKDSRDEIHRQNKELTLLATRDPLTSCLNRRSFFTEFETAWKAAQSQATSLACAMVDIDHFKAINDTHGHGAGDQVLQQVSAILRTSAREQDLVCRYGGEEFCIVMPATDLAQGLELMEQVRHRIATTRCADLDVTASLGASALDLGARDPRELLDQADKSLYMSKRNGRNRVTSFRDVPPGLEVKPTNRRQGTVDNGPQEVPIPFHAVTALASALAYRDILTGEHSRRVADLCVATARGLISERECYVLEVAALLHDIGKLGVPDAILLKPGSLTLEEWKVMDTHVRIGVEIISAAFSSPELTEIVRAHHATYGGSSRDPSLPQGEDIPLAARILTIADAYDAIVSDRVYRKARSQREAFAELRKFAGSQFDPQLVERFIEAVSSHDSSRNQPPLAVSKHTALRIGLQIERLAGALDAQDFPNLAAMASRLAATASQEGVPEIARLASELEACASADPDLMTVVKMTTDLLELCRSTQSSYVARQAEEPAVAGRS
jgi:diguanylate cyclase (GGDEF)-like protein/putative nucleotidyltransferase with HDIG domain